MMNLKNSGNNRATNKRINLPTADYPPNIINIKIPNMPRYTRIITSLSDFIILIDEILTKYGASVFLEDKTNDGFINKLVVTDDIVRLVKSNRDKNLNFFITTLSLEYENRFNFYDDAQCKFVIEGRGGRENATELEMLQLRVISKTPDCLINKISNEINLKLKKDSGYDSEILRGSYKVFYSKAYLGKKKFVYEIDNSLLPMIEIGNNVD